MTAECRGVVGAVRGWRRRQPPLSVELESPRFDGHHWSRLPDPLKLELHVPRLPSDGRLAVVSVAGRVAQRRIRTQDGLNPTLPRILPQIGCRLPAVDPTLQHTVAKQPPNWSVGIFVQSLSSVPVQAFNIRYLDVISIIKLIDKAARFAVISAARPCLFVPLQAFSPTLLGCERRQLLRPESLCILRLREKSA